jgi:hypothetical protein
MLRRWFTWVVAGVVVAVGGFAAIDALRSSGGEPTASAPSATESVTTTQTETGADIESSAELQDGRAVRLIPGRVTTAGSFRVDVTFTVPPGWYGHQAGGFFVIAKSPPPSEVAMSFTSGGIAVRALQERLPSVLRDLESERSAGLRVQDVSPVRIGGYSGREYGLVLRQPLFRDVLGVPPDLQPGERLLLLDVRGTTLLIRRGFDSDQERAEVERVLTSFEFPR